MKANTAGRIAEDILASVLTSLGVVFDRQVVVGTTIYETDYRVDFVALNFAGYPNGVIIESKWQDVGGSVDEKFPYLVENIWRASLPAIVIVQGGGCRESAWRWLHEQVQEGAGLDAVLDLEEFISWALRAEKVASPITR